MRNYTKWHNGQSDARFDVNEEGEGDAEEYEGYYNKWVTPGVNISSKILS